MSHLRHPDIYRPKVPHARAAGKRAGHIRMPQTLAVVMLLLASPTLTRPGFAGGAPESFADMAKHLLPAVVSISSEQKLARGGFFPKDFPFPWRFAPGRDGEEPRRRAHSLGSGFIIDGEKGIVVTNNHVVEDADKIKVILQDDTDYTAEVVGTDPETDTAVLRIDTEGDRLPEVSWGDSDTARIGDWVVAMGTPLGLGGTVTAGIISARDRNIQSGNYDDYIQTDASINRGNSGGPLFNMDGAVIGINTAIFSQTGGSIGIGFSIPSNLAKEVVDQILTYGSTRRGWLGVTVQPVTGDIADSLGMKEAAGAFVAKVHDGPAAAAGFKAGDVIVEFNGHAVADNHELLHLVARAPVGETIAVVVWRDGKRVTLNPILGQREKVDVAALSDSAGARHGGGRISKIDLLGLRIVALTDALVEEFGIDPNEAGGVMIADVASGSDAAEKGLRRGDVILEVNQNAVTAPKDIEAEVNQALEAGRSSVLLKVLQGDRKRFVAVRFAR